MNTSTKCPKCEGEMQEGFIMEERIPVRWIAGKLETGFLGRTKARGKEHRHIESYRCVKCGFLESYATTVIE